jgi:hypothetical protein
MGILFNTSTWRAPLLIIDSWLPPRHEAPARRAQPAVLQRFIRAGWLGRRGAAPRAERSTNLIERTGVQTSLAAGLAVVRRGGSAEPWGSDSRVVIAGRMRDVCAELDRLVAVEQQQRAAGH